MDSVERPAYKTVTLKKFPSADYDWLKDEVRRREKAGLPNTFTAIVVDALRLRRTHGGHTPDEGGAGG